jgi:hypothetical protein
MRRLPGVQKLDLQVGPVVAAIVARQSQRAPPSVHHGEAEPVAVKRSTAVATAAVAPPLLTEEPGGVSPA